MLFEIIPMKAGNYALLEGYFDPYYPLLHPRGTVRIRSCDAYGKILQTMTDEERNTQDSYSDTPKVPNFDIIAYPNGQIVTGRADQLESEEQVIAFHEEIGAMVSRIVTPEVRAEAHEEAIIAEAMTLDSLIAIMQERIEVVEQELDNHQLRERLHHKREELESDNFARLRAAIARKFKEAGETYPDKEE